MEGKTTVAWEKKTSTILTSCVSKLARGRFEEEFSVSLVQLIRHVKIVGLLEHFCYQ